MDARFGFMVADVALTLVAHTAGPTADVVASLSVTLRISWQNQFGSTLSLSL